MKTLRNTLTRLVEKQKKILDKISIIQMEIKTLSATMDPVSIKKAAVIANKLNPLHSEHSKIKQEIESTRTKLVAKEIETANKLIEDFKKKVEASGLSFEYVCKHPAMFTDPTAKQYITSAQGRDSANMILNTLRSTKVIDMLESGKTKEQVLKTYPGYSRDIIRGITYGVLKPRVYTLCNDNGEKFIVGKDAYAKAPDWVNEILNSRIPIAFAK